ncbi:hypothetical protein N9B72_00150 [Bacteriovoracaceae bacterium]|nr:hypothetical protein [Bacteriovoracaceae bacterium]
MNEIFDKLIIRITFSVFICLLIFLYRYAHRLLYPSSKKQMFRKFYPSENSADTIHMFARVIGICLIYSTLSFDGDTGVFVSLFHFSVWGVLSFTVYLISIYVSESITLYNFIYADEVLKRKNMSYAIVSFSISICLAMLIRKIIVESEFSIILLIMFWLYSLVLFGLCIKLYQFVSKFKFNQLMIQKNVALAFSFSGYLFGITTIIITAFNQEHLDIKRYAVQVTLSVLLSLIIFPIFHFGIKLIFKVQEDLIKKDKGIASFAETEVPELGYGIYEGILFYSSALLTSIIVGQIQFGIIYPFF